MAYFYQLIGKMKIFYKPSKISSGIIKASNTDLPRKCDLSHLRATAKAEALKTPMDFGKIGIAQLRRLRLIKEALIQSTCVDLRQKFLLTRKKSQES